MSLLCNNADLVVCVDTNSIVSLLEFDAITEFFNFIDEMVLPPNHYDHLKNEHIDKIIVNRMRNGM